MVIGTIYISGGEKLGPNYSYWGSTQSVMNRSLCYRIEKSKGKKKTMEGRGGGEGMGLIKAGGYFMGRGCRIGFNFTRKVLEPYRRLDTVTHLHSVRCPRSGGGNGGFHISE